jgi:ferritin-like metal-binding protein YciE
MATQGTLKDAFLDELRDTYSAEKQLIKALPKVAKAASSPDLRAAVEQHLQETRGQVDRLVSVFEALGEKPRAKHCDGMAGIIEEGNSAMEEDVDAPTMDAMLIASAQRAEHYEMAAYGTLVAWARALGHDEAADLLQQTLDEEKATDEKLTTLGEGGINERAAGGGEDDDDEEDEPAPTSSRQSVKAGARAPARSVAAPARGSRGAAAAKGSGGRAAPSTRKR